MKNQNTQANIELQFKNLVQADKKIKNAYLLVHSDRLGIDLNLAEGETDGFPAHPSQANHLASVGKIFTATLIGMLKDRGKLAYEDKIALYLDSELMTGLHKYKGMDCSSQITVKHLLQQTSGLNDVFFQLLHKIKSGNFATTPRQAVIWGKQNLKPKFPPGKGFFYTDTNYILLGLIIESICQKPLHEVMSDYLFKPLNMNYAYLMGFSQPALQPEFPPAKVYIDNFDVSSLKGIEQIDYAGGSVMAPLSDFLLFMRALVQGKLLSEQTLALMLNDSVPMGLMSLSFDYGYSIWKVKSIPLLLPKKFISWGCVGITGAFMFYHPLTDSYVIGTFNDSSYRSKGLRFMLTTVIRELVKAY